MFELQPLEPRILLSGEGFTTAFGGALLLEPWMPPPLFQSTIVEMSEAELSVEDFTSPSTTAGSGGTDDLFVGSVPIASNSAGGPTTTATTPALTPILETTNAAATTLLSVVSDAAIHPAVEAPVLDSHLSVTTLPNGPPAADSSLGTTSESLTPTAAEPLSLASSFTSGLSSLQTQLPTWGSFFNLGSVNFAAQGLTALSLPILPDALNSLFDLGSKLGAVNLPSFATAETKEAFVTQLRARNFTLRSIEGGFSADGTTIAASTGTTRLDGSYTLTIATGFGVASAYSSSTYNTATPSILTGIASNAEVSGSVSWTGSLSLTLNFALDSSAGLRLLGDSAMSLTVSGNGLLSGSAAIGGANGNTLDGSASAALTIALGFRNPTAYYAPGEIGATTLTPVASGTASLSLSFTTGPAALTYVVNYTEQGNAVSGVTSQSVTLSLAGKLTLPGITTNAGTAAAVSLNGSYSSATQTWTIAGSTPTGLQMFGQSLNQLSVAVVLTPSAFSGTFTSQLQTDFFREGATPVTLDLSATYDRSVVNVTASATRASLNLSDSGNNRLLALTTASLGGTFAGNVVTGALTGSLKISAVSATFQPDQTAYTATITDGADADTYGLIGTYDFTNRTLVLAIDQFALLVANVFRAAATEFTLTYDRTKTDPTQIIAELTSAKIDLLALQQSNSPEPPAITISKVTIRQNGFAFANATATFGDYIIGGSASFGSLTVSLDNISYTTGAAPSGVIGLSAATGTLFPGKSATASLTTVSGSFNLVSKAFSLTIGTLNATIGTTLAFSGTGVGFGYDPTAPPSQVIIKADALTATLPSSSVSGTLTGLEVTAAGGFSAISLSLDSSGFAKTLGMGELLPFEITSLYAKFRGDTNGNGARDDGETFSLTAFDLTVRGYFDFKKLNGLPFTPIIRVGPPGAAQQSFEKATQTFEFTVTVSSSGIKPKDIGPIEIGFSDLRIGETVTLGGTIVLGGYQNSVFVPQFGGTFSLVSKDNVKDVTTSVAAVLIGTFDTAARTIEGSGSITVNFSYGTYVAVQDAQLNFTFGLKADNAFSLSVTHRSLTSGTIASVRVVFGTQMIFTATGATLDFTATGKQALATFDRMSVKFPPVLNLTGTATNFGFAADGSLITRPGFAAWIDIDSISLKWPTWLPFRIDGIGLSWPDFSLDPLKFVIILSGSVTSLNGLTGLKVEGSVKNAIIDLRLLAEGKFPLVGLDLVAISVSGTMFGGQASGTLALGLIRFDAAGRQLGGTDYTTPVSKTVLYGAIEGGFTFASMAGFNIRVGVSELGPLQVYLSVTGTQILDASSGLAIKDFRAGVMFNTELPAINDPLQLRNSAFTPAAQMTLNEWLAALETAVANQARSPPSGDFWSVFSRPMRIEGGATLFSAYASTSSFRADVDIIFDTNGKVLINARGIFADSFSFNFRLYTDLTKLSTDPTFIFLSEQPQNPTTLTLRGRLQFKFLQADGKPASASAPATSYNLSLVGGVDVVLPDLATVTIDGTVTLTFTASRTTLDYKGTLKVGLIGDVAQSTGRFVFEHVGTHIDLWGVGQIEPKFNQLESLGLFVSGTAWLGINTSDEMKGENGYLLKPRWFAITVPDGAIQVKQGGANLFKVDGAVRFEVTTLGLDLSLAGKLRIGPTSAPIVTFNVLGYLAVRNIGVAGRIDLTLDGKVGGTAAKLEFDATYQLLFNTTGTTISYLLPVAFDPVGGSRSVTVSGTAPGATSAAAYFCVEIRGGLSLAGQFKLTNGIYRLTVTTTSVRLEVAAQFQLDLAGVRLLGFNVSGGFELGTDGVAAALSLTIRAGEGVRAEQGWSITGTFQLLFSSKATESVLAGTVVPANAMSVRASGTIAVGGLELSGLFSITIWGSDEIDILVLAGLPIKAGDVTVFTLRVIGTFQVSSAGLASVLNVSLAPDAGVPASHNWTLTATYRLDLNTRSSAFTFGGVTVPAGTARIFIDGAIKAAGFELTGTFLLTVSTNGVSMAATAKAKLLGVAFDVSGALGIYSDGLAFSLAITLPRLQAGTFSVGGEFAFAVNTSSVTRLEIAARSGYLAASVELSLAGIGVSGGVRISSSGRIDIPSGSPLATRILGQSASVSGYVDLATGTFDLTGTLAINLGNPAYAGIKGDLKVRLYRTSANNVISSGLVGTFNAALSAFGIKLGDLKGSTNLGPTGAFDLSLNNISFTLSKFVAIQGGFSIHVGPDRVVSLTFSGSLNIFGRFKSTISGWANSGTPGWQMTGTATASFGDGNLGASISVNVRLGGGYFVTKLGGRDFREAISSSINISGSAWARVRVAGYTIGIDGSFSTSLTGESVTVTVTGSLDIGITTLSASKDLGINFRTGSIWLSEVGGSVVFFDVNRNGVHDPGEPITQADGTGSFAFDPVDSLPSSAPVEPAPYNHLGRLLPYDRNGNGRIDGDEGAFVLTGGVALIDGSANAQSVLLGVAEGHAGYRDATVFLDLNRNRRLDEGEHFARTDLEGFYTFDEAHDFVELAALGLLAPFDLNHNGVIDGDEGLLRVNGGRMLVAMPDAGLAVGDVFAGTIGIAPSMTGMTFVVQGHVFLDVNGNGQADPGEPNVTTGADGSYTFDPQAIAARVAALGRLGGFDKNQNGVIDPDEGKLVAVGGVRIGGEPKSGVTNFDPDDLLKANATSGMIASSAATVFLDRNDNGRLDADEVFTTSSTHGFYTFLHDSQFSNDLGALTVYDVNGNGILDPQEGVFVISGGVDLNTGLVNSRTLTVLATNYGSIFGTQISPLSELYTYLVLSGFSTDDANTVMHHAFGLPQTVDMMTFDPDEFTNLEDDGEIAAKLISFMASAGAEIIQSLTEARSPIGQPAITLGEAEDFVIYSLAAYVKRVEAPAGVAVDADGNLIGGTPTLKLDDAAVARAVLTDALTRAGISLPPVAQFDAAIAALDQFLDYVMALRAANVGNITGALGRLSAAMHKAFHQALDDLFDGRLALDPFNLRFTADGVRQLIRTTEIPTPNAPPNVSIIGTPDTTRADIEASRPLAVSLRVADPDNLPSDVELTIQSSNPALVPAAKVTVLGMGASRTILVSPNLGRTGTATLTVQASDGQRASGAQAIQRFTVTIVYSYANLMNDLAIRTRHNAEEAAARIEREATDIDASAGESLAETLASGTPGEAMLFVPAPSCPLVGATSLGILETPRQMQELPSGGREQKS